MPLSALGSAIWRREDVQRGLEAGQCYYLQNAMRLRGKNEIDLSSDPPPDLAIEFEVSPAPLNRMSIYAALRVPEVWRYDGAHIKVFCLEDEAYAERASSVAFDDFRPDELQQFLALDPSMLDGEIVRAFRAWLHASHKP